MWTAVLGTDLDWDFMTVPQPELKGRQIGQPQGRVLGGSSAINGENFAPPSATVIDAWADMGNPGWEWSQLVPYYRKFHTFNPPAKDVAQNHGIDWIDESIRGTDSPVQSSFSALPEDPLGNAWVESFKNLKYPLQSDPFAGKATGPWSQTSSIDPRTKTRSYSASAYYTPIARSRPSLTVVTGATVHKVLLEGEGESLRASGSKVKLASQERPIRISTSKEVLLAADIFQSPKILELSGIGSKSVLQSHGITTSVDLPGVGENLQDHLMTDISFEAADGVQTGDPLMRQEHEVIQMCMKLYQEHQAGPFAMASLGSFAYMPVMEDFMSVPEDFKALVDKYAPGPSSSKLELLEYAYAKSVLQTPSEGSAALFMIAAQVNLYNGPRQIGMLSDAKPGSFISIGASVSHPLSRGTSHISSSDPNAPPTIDPRYLSHPLDIELYARHLMGVEKLSATAPLSKYIKQNGVRAQPGNPKLDELERTKEYICETALTGNHPVGTCAMVPRDLGGVVDPRLMVYGVKGLRVVDASIMPLITRGNTQTLVYAVAEKAADLIKEDHGLAVA